MHVSNAMQQAMKLDIAGQFSEGTADFNSTLMMNMETRISGMVDTIFNSMPASRQGTTAAEQLSTRQSIREGVITPAETAGFMQDIMQQAINGIQEQISFAVRSGTDSTLLRDRLAEIRDQALNLSGVQASGGRIDISTGQIYQEETYGGSSRGYSITNSAGRTFYDQSGGIVSGSGRLISQNEYVRDIQARRESELTSGGDATLREYLDIENLITKELSKGSDGNQDFIDSLRRDASARTEAIRNIQIAARQQIEQAQRDIDDSNIGLASIAEEIAQERLSGGSAGRISTLEAKRDAILLGLENANTALEDAVSSYNERLAGFGAIPEIASQIQQQASTTSGIQVDTSQAYNIIRERAQSTSLALASTDIDDPAYIQLSQELESYKAQLASLRGASGESTQTAIDATAKGASDAINTALERFSSRWEDYLGNGPVTSGGMGATAFFDRSKSTQMSSELARMIGGVDDPAQRENLIRQYNEGIRNAASNMSEAARDKLDQLQTNLDDVNTLLQTSYGADRRNYARQRREIEREISRQQSIIDNAGLLDQYVNQNAPAIANGIGSRIASSISSALNSMPLLLGASGMLNQGLFGNPQSQSLYSAMAGGALTTAGIYGSIGQSIGGNYGLVGGGILGGVIGGISAQQT